MSARPATTSTPPPSSSSSWPCSGRCCTPAPRTPTRAGWGWTTLQRGRRHPAGRTRDTAGRPVRPRLPGRRPRHHPGRRQAADRRRPGADLPPPPPLGPRGRRAGAGLAGPGHLPGDPRPVRRGRRVRRPAHLRDPGQDPPGQRRPARRRSPAVVRPRPRHRRRTTRNWTEARRLGQAPRPNPGDHRCVHDPGHPRRRALRPDREPPRRRARRPRRHRRPRHPPRPGRRDPRRPPVRPRPAVRHRRRLTEHAAGSVR